jgi:hypothetical protein
MGRENNLLKLALVIDGTINAAGPWILFFSDDTVGTASTSNGVTTPTHDPH